MGTPKYLCCFWMCEKILRDKVALCEGRNITIKISPKVIFFEISKTSIFLNGIIYLFFYILVEHKKANSVFCNNVPFRSSDLKILKSTFPEVTEGV
jgi:hypothetical protein